MLDFGLAKARSLRAPPAMTLNSPTNSPARHAGGMIIGTAAYMSPEQARGRGGQAQRTSGRSAACSTRCSRAGAVSDGDDVTDTLAAVVQSRAQMERAAGAARRWWIKRLLKLSASRKDPRRRACDGDIGGRVRTRHFDGAFSVS